MQKLKFPALLGGLVCGVLVLVFYNVGEQQIKAPPDATGRYVDSTGSFVTALFFTLLLFICFLISFLALKQEQKARGQVSVHPNIFIGGVFVVLGVVLFFVLPIIGLLMFVVAGGFLLGGRQARAQKQREIEQRHEEVVAARVEQEQVRKQQEESTKPIILNPGDTVLGNKVQTKQPIPVSDVDRQSGLYVLGVQGVGKSSMLEGLIHQDIKKDYAVVVLDPHGDLIDHVIAQMPLDKVSKTFVLDMQDENYPFGVNLFTLKQAKTSIAEAQAVDRVMHVFEALWGDVLSQQGLPRYLRAATLALLQNPETTLVDMIPFLQDDRYRERLLQNVQDISVQQFWEYQYNSLSESARFKRVESLVNRLETLFMGRSIVRNILGQAHSTIDFRRAIENKEIVLIRLPLRVLEQDAKLIGTMLIAQLHAAIFSFSDLPLEKRPGFSLYIDEFQNFVTKDIEEIFTQGRKFGARLAIAHQARYQIPDFLAGASLTARTIVTFQTTPQDAQHMAPLYVRQETMLRQEDIFPDVIKRLLTYGHPHPTVDKFIKVYLRPVQMMLKGNRLTMQQWKQKGVAKVWGDIQQERPVLANPFPLLNELLYDAEKKRNWTAQIPYHVVLGFADCGVGFYRTFDECSNRAKEILTTTQLLRSENLVNNIHFYGSAQQKRQLLDFLHTLRGVMQVLAQEPLGELKQQTPAEVAQHIVNLPLRHALVRVGKDIATIYTANAPAFVTPERLKQRRIYIQKHTRQTYCRDRASVEQDMRTRQQQILANKQQKPASGGAANGQKANAPPQAGQRFAEVDDE